MHKRSLAILLVLCLALTFASPAAALPVMDLRLFLGSPTLADTSQYRLAHASVLGASPICGLLISFTGDLAAGDAILLPADGEANGFTPAATSTAYAKRITFTSPKTAGAVQAYIRAVTFQTAGTQRVQITLSTLDIPYDTYYYEYNDHYYQYVPHTTLYYRWDYAYADAGSMSLLGRTGYLANITSLGEDVFIKEISNQVGWLGGTRLKRNADGFNLSSTENYWYWADGPEANDTFYTTATYSSGNDSLSVSNGYYFNWFRNPTGEKEPNNAGGNEQCLTTLKITGSGVQGTVDYSWNDINYLNYSNQEYNYDTYGAKGFFVEYGDQIQGDSGDDQSDTMVTALATIDMDHLYRESGSYAPTSAILTDNATGAQVSGAIASGAVLTGTALGVGSAPAIAFAQYAGEQGQTLLQSAELTLTPAPQSAITLSLPVNAAYNGQTLTLLLYQNGALAAYMATAMDGRVAFPVEALGPFALLYAPVGLVGLPKTGGAASLPPALSLALAALAAYGAARRKRRGR